jgi:hypothetical protein
MRRPCAPVSTRNNVTFMPGRCRVVGVPRGRFYEVLYGRSDRDGRGDRPGSCRLHEAAARAAAGTAVDWVRLAAELGYSDQAHFTRDFTATIGVPPATYAKAVR